jgi:hypothetical protein
MTQPVSLGDPLTGHRSPLPLRCTMRAPGSPPVARLVWTSSGSALVIPYAPARWDSATS